MPEEFTTSTSSAAASPASLGQSPVSAAGQPTNGTSGRSSSDSSPNFDLDWFLGKMSEGLSTLGLITLSVTLKAQATRAGRLWWRLKTLAHRTSGNASSLWPSTARDSATAQQKLRLWRTPCAFDAEEINRTAKGWEKCKAYCIKLGRTNVALSGLYEQMQLEEAGISTYYRQWPEGLVPEPKGGLNPEWVEALMGFPVGWTQVDFQADQDNHKRRGSRRASPR